jgi:UTP--glucose-1-phosphate uridylyltransferase
MSLRSLSVEHFNLTSMSADNNLDKAVAELAATVSDGAARKKFEQEMKGMKQIFHHYLQTKNEVIDWTKIKPPSDDVVMPYANLSDCSPKRLKELSSKLAVLKLNGGLGTTMGCVGPKSAIEVREGQSFLDLTVKQIKVRSV